MKSCLRIVRISFAFLLTTLCWCPLNVPGAVRIWTGGAAPNDNWSAASNWDTGVPQNNDSLVFNAAVGAGSITNNLSNRTFAQISFSGVGSSFFVHGNPIRLTGGISQSSSGGANTVNLDITLATNTQTFAVTGAGVGSALTITGDINLNGENLTVNVTDDGTTLTLSGVISGTGNVTRGTGAGGLVLSGSAANTFVGTTTINGGYIRASKPNGVTSLPGDVSIGNGVGVDTLIMSTDDQFGASSDVTIRDGGIFDNNNETNIIASLTFNDGGRVETTTGRLELGGTVSVIGSGVSNAIINGNLHLGAATRTFNIANTAQAFDLDVNGVISGGSSDFFFPAGIIKSGAGVMRVNAANTYGGATSVNDGTLRVNNNLGLGGTVSFFGSAGTFVNSNAVLLLNNAHVTNEVLTLNSTNSAGALQVEATGDWIGNITLSRDVVIEASSLLQLGGVISGPGGFTKVGTQTLRMIGADANTYTGVTRVNAGILELDRTAFDGSIRGDLVVGDGSGSDIVRNLNSNQILNTSHVTVNLGGLLDLNNAVEGIGDLELTGGAVDSGTSSLVLFDGGVTSNPSSTAATIAGTLNLNGAVRTFDIANGAPSPDVVVNAVISNGGIVKTGLGNLRFSGANTYAGLTTVNDGFLHVNNPSALGAANAGTVLTGGGDLLIEGETIVGEPLTNNSAGLRVQSTGACAWSGPIVLNALLEIEPFGAGTLDISGPVSGVGGLTKDQAGTLIFSGTTANTYAGITTVNVGILELRKTVNNVAVPGVLVIGDGVGGVNADQVRIFLAAQIDNGAPVTVNSSGLLEFNIGFDENFGSLAGSGNVSLVSAGSRMDVGSDGTSTTFSGTISGVGGLQKEGGGIMTLSGVNTYNGSTIVNAGTLLVNGFQAASPVTVAPSATLGGDGTVGDLVANGTISPGASPAVLTSGDAAFNGTANFNIEINGSAPGTGYDRLSVAGTTALAGALNVTVGGGFAPTAGEQFTIINNDGAEPVAGTFAGLPNGSILTLGIHKFLISYGNDVILTYTNPPLAVNDSQVSGGNGNNGIDPNECNNLDLVITNVSGAPLTGITAALSSLTPGVVITQPDSAYANIGINARGTNTTPFQISTLPTFVCGQTIELKLTVTTAAGSFAIPFSLQTGFEGLPVGFSNLANLAIADSASVTSIVNVAAFDTPITKVSVTLHITHSAVEDLDISLISPDGTMIVLSSDNGGTGDDYGTDCLIGSRTHFTDSAASSIIGASAPFSGSYRPEQQLSAYIGMEGGAVNGPWKLVITDDSGGATGTLRCWSVILSPTDCATGAGYCDTCPGVFTGSITTNDATRAARIERFNAPSTCATPGTCSSYPFGPYHYDSYTFTNSGGDACISVTLDTPCGNTLSAEAYLGSHNPADLCSTYLADLSYLPSLQNGTFSFSVPAGAVFVVVVTEIDSGSGCDYTLAVQGLDCPPILAIEPVPTDRVRLHWPTTAGGYELESTPALPATTWTTVTNQPFVDGGRFNVTNSSINPTNRFYRLNKP